MDGAVERLQDSLGRDRAVLERVATTTDTPNHPDDLRAMDAFLQRFQQTLEHMNGRVLPAIYRIEEPGGVRPAFRTMLLHFERQGLVADSREWGERIEVRNRLAHEYPLSPVNRTRDLLAAIAAATRLVADWRRMNDYVTQRGYLDGIQDD